MKIKKQIRYSFAAALLLMACGTSKNLHKYQLHDGVYQYRQEGKPAVRADVYILDDTARIFSRGTNSELRPDPLKVQSFVARSFDVDVITVPIKIRPATSALPRQLTTDFNGNVFIGYRIDQFRISSVHTPVGVRKTYAHRGFTLGGASAVTPWTTNNKITDEYSGFVLARGFAAMVGVSNLTVGAGIGWDSLTGRDRDVWIYQNRRWYGVTPGLNLN